MKFFLDELGSFRLRCLNGNLVGAGKFYEAKAIGRQAAYEEVMMAFCLNPTNLSKSKSAVPESNNLKYLNTTDQIFWSIQNRIMKK